MHQKTKLRMTIMCHPTGQEPTNSMLIAQTAKIEVINAFGKPSYLPANFYRRMMAMGSRYVDPVTGASIYIEDAGEQSLISVTTNYSPAVGVQHTTHLDPNIVYCLFDGNTMLGKAVKPGIQLRGCNGMYVIQATATATVLSYRVNVSAVDSVHTAERRTDGTRRLQVG